jgi:curved DNA-binding protein CbpA
MGADPYEVLDISRDASPEQVNEAYRALVELYHPDRLQGFSEAARRRGEENLKRVNAAYAEIQEIERRKQGGWGRAEQERAGRDRAQRQRAAPEGADRERTARERADRERTARERADRERAAQERADRERAARERVDRERATRERAQRERAAREQAERQRAAPADSPSRPARPPSSPQPMPARQPRHGRAWAAAALAVVAVVIIGVVALEHGHSPPTSAATRPPATKAPAAALPQTASASFDVTPSFQAVNTPVSGVLTNWANGDIEISMTLTPSLQGFELVIGVNANYTAAGVSMVGSTGEIPGDISGNCMTINAHGTSYHEFPLETDLKASGASVTGNVVYAAVIPGQYSFGIDGCGGVALGNVTTPSLGNSFGSDLGNGLTVFAERTSETDTVLLFGAIGDDGDRQASVGKSCVIGKDSVQADDPIWDAGTVQFLQQKTENGVWYDLGTITFPLPASKLSGASYNYTCEPNSNPGVALHS